MFLRGRYRESDSFGDRRLRYLHNVLAFSAESSASILFCVHCGGVLVVLRLFEMAAMGFKIASAIVRGRRARLRSGFLARQVSQGWIRVERYHSLRRSTLRRQEL
jgi:hypothetical protein